MPTSETDPKPKRADDKPTEKDVQNTKEEDKHVDRDGGERQPVHYANDKT